MTDEPKEPIEDVVGNGGADTPPTPPQDTPTGGEDKSLSWENYGTDTEPKGEDDNAPKGEDIDTKPQVQVRTITRQSSFLQGVSQELKPAMAYAFSQGANTPEAYQAAILEYHRSVSDFDPESVNEVKDDEGKVKALIVADLKQKNPHLTDAMIDDRANEDLDDLLLDDGKRRRFVEDALLAQHQKNKEKVGNVDLSIFDQYQESEESNFAEDTGMPEITSETYTKLAGTDVGKIDVEARKVTWSDKEIRFDIPLEKKAEINKGIADAFKEEMTALILGIGTFNKETKEWEIPPTIIDSEGKEHNVQEGIAERLKYIKDTAINLHYGGRYIEDMTKMHNNVEKARKEGYERGKRELYQKTTGGDSTRINQNNDNGGGNATPQLHKPIGT